VVDLTFVFLTAERTEGTEKFGFFKKKSVQHYFMLFAIYFSQFVIRNFPQLHFSVKNMNLTVPKIAIKTLTFRNDNENSPLSNH